MSIATQAKRHHSTIMRPNWDSLVTSSTWRFRVVQARKGSWLGSYVTPLPAVYNHLPYPVRLPQQWRAFCSVVCRHFLASRLGLESLWRDKSSLTEGFSCWRPCQLQASSDYDPYALTDERSTRPTILNSILLNLLRLYLMLDLYIIFPRVTRLFSFLNQPYVTSVFTVSAPWRKRFLIRLWEGDNYCDKTEKLRYILHLIMKRLTITHWVIGVRLNEGWEIDKRH